MFHPFSRITLQGRSIRGCFETDNLTDATLYFSDGTIDYETMSLLKDHVAHYQFPEICKRFLEHGWIIFFQDNNVKMSAHVAVHSSSLGLKTYDGVWLVGFSNLQAVWDASSIWYWNGNQIRIPWMALSKCMVDSYLVTKNLSSHGNSLQIFPYLGKLNIKIHRKESIIQKINTRFLLKFTFTNIDFTMRDIVNWTEEPLLLPESLDREISIGIVYPHWQRLTYKTMDHTFFPQEMVEDFKKNYRSYCLF